MNLKDLVVSLIRTWTPVAVGVIVAWLAARGLGLDAASTAGLTAGFTGLITAGWYGLVRVLEVKWPWTGILLGYAARPLYVQPSGSIAGAPGSPIEERQAPPV